MTEPNIPTSYKLISLLVALERRTVPCQQTSWLLLQKQCQYILNKVPLLSILNCFKAPKDRATLAEQCFSTVGAATICSKFWTHTLFTF